MSCHPHRGNSVIIVDLDGTLCNHSHRVHHAQSGDWDTFHSLLDDDTPNDDIVHFLEHVSTKKTVFLVSGRNEKYRLQTQKWLSHYRLGGHADMILLRPDGNFDHDQDIKIKMIEDVLRHEDDIGDEWKKRIWICLDDRDKVVSHFRDNGLRVWQVREGTF